MSGLSYTIDASIPSSATTNDENEFTGVDGAYRVTDVMVGDQPLDVNKTYTLASHNYMLKNGGDGFVMFKTDKLLKDSVMIDNAVLINYIVDELGGNVTAEQYGEAAGRINIANAAAPEEKPEEPAPEEKPAEPVPEEKPAEPAPEEKPAEPVPEEKPAVSPNTYEVVKGDCLWKIAQKFYGTGVEWNTIYEANKDTIKNPDEINVGQILVIPAK